MAFYMFCPVDTSPGIVSFIERFLELLFLQAEEHQRNTASQHSSNLFEDLRREELEYQ